MPADDPVTIRLFDPNSTPATAHDKLRETCLSSSPRLRGGFLTVNLDEVRLPDGRQATREYVLHPGAAMIVPLWDDAHVLMERQYRYPLGQVMLELPAGKIDAFEDPFLSAQRELQEETGCVANEWAYAGVMHNAIAYSNESIEVWFARGLSVGPRRLDEGEFLDVVKVSDQALGQAVRDGLVTDAKTMIGWMYLQQFRSGAWPLAWRAATRP